MNYIQCLFNGNFSVRKHYVCKVDIAQIDVCLHSNVEVYKIMIIF